VRITEVMVPAAKLLYPDPMGQVDRTLSDAMNNDVLWDIACLRRPPEAANLQPPQVTTRQGDAQETRFVTWEDDMHQDAELAALFQPEESDEGGGLYTT
jgi:hypothetical protein